MGLVGMRAARNEYLVLFVSECYLRCRNFTLFIHGFEYARKHCLHFEQK